MKHALLPWKDTKMGLISSADGKFVCQFFDKQEEDFDAPEANAEFIVCACNSFDDLLAACEAALSHLRYSTKAAKELKELIRGAIAKAREKP